MNTNLSDCWLGYLTYATIEKCVSLSKEYCPGCIQGLISSLLHDHQQASLLNKIETYLNESRGLLSSKLDEMFTDFLKHMKRSTIEEEKQTLITNGRNFLFIVTPLSLYYGRFLTEKKYSALFTESYNPKKPPHPPKRKRPTPSHQEPDNNLHKKKKISTHPPQTSYKPDRNPKQFDIESLYDSE